MKSITALVALFICVAAHGQNAPLHPLAVSVSVQVDQIDSKATNWKTEWGSYNKISSFARVLRISAKTNQRDADPAVLLKYAFIGWDISGKRTVVYDSGNKPFTVTGGLGSNTFIVSGVQQSRDDKYVALEQRYRSGIQPRGWLVMIEQAGKPVAVQSSTPEVKDWLRNEIVEGRASFDNSPAPVAKN
jgi:hypothetical protein